ncbi:hypothetical protein BH10ACT1_BH10ACT1_26080 [soil metagenome]
MTTAARARKAAFAVLGVLVLAAAWEGYKALGGHLFGFTLPFKADDSSMPHLATIVERLGDPENRGSERTVGTVVARSAWYTFQIAMVGLAFGTLVGLLLAGAMQRFRVVERGLLPFIVMSQTIPIVAFAPLIGLWGGRLSFEGHEWEPWMSVATVAAFLSFAPIAVGMLRGLNAPTPASVELMRSLAAPQRKTLWKLRLPASVPYLVPALRLAAAGAVVGAIVAEISLGRSGGIGRLILEYSRAATSDPAKVYTAILGAGVLGLVVAAGVATLDLLLTRNRPPEAA